MKKLQSQNPKTTPEKKPIKDQTKSTNQPTKTKTLHQQAKEQPTKQKATVKKTTKQKPHANNAPWDIPAFLDGESQSHSFALSIICSLRHLALL